MRPLAVATFLLSVLLLGPAARTAAADSMTDIFDPADVLFDDGVGGDPGGTCTGTNSTVNDLLDAVSGLTNGKCTTLTFTHYLTGYSDPPSTLTSALLTLYFYDDNVGPGSSDVGGQPEQFDLQLDSGLFLDGGTIGEASHAGSQSQLGAYSVIADVLSNGQLNVTLLWDQGDFMFARSELFGEWRTSTSGGGEGEPAVPEPASLVLFGLGLAGVARVTKRRRRGRFPACGAGRRPPNTSGLLATENGSRSARSCF